MTIRYDERDLKRARVGGLLITLIVTVSLAVFFLDDVIRLTTEGPMITVTTSSAPGVQPGTAVWVAGRSVGRVVSIRFREPVDARDRVVIRAILERGVERFIRADAEAAIQPGALLEPVVVFVSPGSAEQPAWDLSEPLRALDRTPSPEALLEMSGELRTATEELSEQAARVSSAIAEGGGTLGALQDDPDVLRDAGSRLAAARLFVTEYYEDGTMGRFARDTNMAPRFAHIRSGLAVLDSLSTRRRAGRSLEETAAALEAFTNRLIALGERLDAGEGTAGRALRDGELARQVALLRARLDSTTAEFVKHPDRWLKVKVF